MGWREFQFAFLLVDLEHKGHQSKYLSYPQAFYAGVWMFNSGENVRNFVATLLYCCS
jgi:hypothetical protein